MTPTEYVIEITVQSTKCLNNLGHSSRGRELKPQIRDTSVTRIVSSRSSQRQFRSDFLD